MVSQIHYKIEKNFGDRIIELLKDSDLPTSDLSGKNHVTFMSASMKNSEDLLGVVALETFGEAGILRSLAVNQDYQKRGLGTDLVMRLEQYANQESIKNLFLLTETADKFFEHLDYKVIPRNDVPEAIQNSSQFSKLCPSTATCMHKKLNG